MSKTKRKVAYFYDPDIGGFYYGPGHPMKPHRIRMAHNLILHYGLANMMEVYRPRPASAEDMQTFHAEDYIEFLRNVSTDNKEQYEDEMRRFNVGDDCPVFTGQYKYCQLYAGGSIGGAVKLNYGNADIVINWAGGLHHAKKAEASGFCYVNDIVLAILELLKYHARVLYVDIDIHHGDGVEEAFLTTDRVCTVSFHKFGAAFFPGTGDLANLGVGAGRYHAVNVPLKDGMTDEAYEQVFQPVMRRVVEVYQPEVIVFQSGADSLAGDRLGAFNLSMKGHAECQQFMMGFGLPMLVLGGGGYKINNVARCWTYETGRILGCELEDELPENEYREYFAPDYRLHIPLRSDVENLNTREYLDQLKRKLFANIARIGTANGVPFYERPPDALREEDLVTTDAAPQPESVARLWDGRSSDADGGGRAHVGSASRSRDDRDYSDDPASTTDKEKSESPAIGKGGRAAMWQPPGRTGSLLHNGGAPGKSSSGVMPMEVDRAGPAETDRGPSIAQEC